MSQDSQKNDYRALLQQALVTLEQMEGKLQAVEQAQHEPLAIIGMGFRFPGEADDAESFWKLLYHGTDAISEIPADRWSAEEYYDPDPDAVGKMYTRWGGFLKHVDQFDPQFFGISPREAISMDPQQRLLLETTWEALENAGQASSKLAGSRAGVFIGMVGSDYTNLEMISGAIHDMDAYFATGAARSIAAGRIAYTFGLHGPAVSVDTACSSSLVAAHQACRSLRSGECDMAIAGGVNLILEPSGSISTSRGRMMSFDGRCKTFDATADGYVRAEGCAMIVLKRLSDAQADGDNILAVILGSALNQDGRSNGLTAPNAKAQEDVIRAALEDARRRPADISYVETHGTGTSLGDPIEVRALGAVFSEGHGVDNPLMIGSVKTNVGHLEAAAGVVGLVKVVLALQNKTIPPHIHLKEPNPYIPWNELPITVPTKPTTWAVSDDKPRVAGLSSFGFSGTNAHFIIAEAPASPIPETQFDRASQLLTLSAKTEDALKELVEQYEDYFTKNLSASLADVAYSLNTGRSHFHYRLALTANSIAQAQEKLSAWKVEGKSSIIHSGKIVEDGKPEVVFLFTGQGSQYIGMARQLYESQPTFKSMLDRCDALLRPHLDKPLLSVIYPKDKADENLIHQTIYTQPALFAVEYCLAKLWQAWGVEPAVVMGHSVGEYVAACVAGVFSLEDGLKLIAARGRMMQSLPQGGVMMSITTDEKRVRTAIAPYEHEVSIAAVNGPSAVVISGTESGVGLIVDALRQDGVKSQQLSVSHAFHSQLMDPILDEFERMAKSIQYHSPQIGVISNVSGTLIVDDSMACADYWRAHVRQAVRFADGIQALHNEGYRFHLEIGPTPTLLGLASRCEPSNPEDVWLPSLRAGRGDWDQMLESLGQLYVYGQEVDWDAFERDYRGQRRRLALPTYPFQRERYWLDFGPASYKTFEEKVDHPLLGTRLSTAMPVFQNYLNPDNPAYLADHVIHDMIVLPAAAYIEIALAAAKQALGERNYMIEDISIRDALLLSHDEDRLTQIMLTSDSNGASFQYFSRAKDDAQHSWQLHANGRISHLQADDLSHSPALDEVRTRLSQPMPVDAYYEHLATLGAVYGPAFRCINEIWRTDGEALGRIQLPESETDDANQYSIHPALLDACFQLIGTAIPGAGHFDSEDNNKIYVPIGIQRIRILGEVSNSVHCYVQLLPIENPKSGTLVSDVYIFNEAGRVLAIVNGLLLQQIKPETLRRLMQKNTDQWLYQVDWIEQPRKLVSRQQTDTGHWIIFADESLASATLVKQLRSQGEECLLVFQGDTFENNDSYQWKINPAVRDHYRQLLAEINAEIKEPVRGVVHLWNMRELISDQMDLSTIHASLERTSGSILHLVQALAGIKEHAPHLWLVTNGAQAVKTDSTINPVSTSLWGLGNVISLEHPAFHCVRIDLDPSDPDGSDLFHEIWGPTEEDQIAFRDGKRYVARLVRDDIQKMKSNNLTIRSDVAYLITGGLGGLGLVSAHWLAAQGARHLVLAGRKGPSENVQRAINEIRSQGVGVHIAQADISQREQVEKLLEHIQTTMPPLRGIIHAAGVLDDGILLEQTWSRFTTVMAPKIDGVWNLHTLTSDSALDFFILFSAGASVLGSAGQGNYVAANAFLDGMAHYRRSCGLPAQSINWGRWAEVGMATSLDDKNQRRHDAHGLGSIKPSEGTMIMEQIITRNPVQVAVLPIDWKKFSRTLEGKHIQPLLRGFVNTGPEVECVASVPLILNQLKEAQGNEQEEILRKYTRDQITKTLGLDSAQPFDANRALTDIGMDSLMAVELRNKIQGDLGINIPVTLLLEDITVANLAKKLQEELNNRRLESGKDDVAGKEIDSSAAKLLLQNLDQLSEDQVNSLLDNLLTGNEDT